VRSASPGGSPVKYSGRMRPGRPVRIRDSGQGLSPYSVREDLVGDEIVSTPRFCRGAVGNHAFWQRPRSGPGGQSGLRNNANTCADKPAPGEMLVQRGWIRRSAFI